MDLILDRMTHPFRCEDPRSRETRVLSPRGTGRTSEAFIGSLARGLWAILRRRGRASMVYALAVFAVLVQGVLLLTAAYLVDLSISLMELWAELARKHLELTV